MHNAGCHLLADTGPSNLEASLAIPQNAGKRVNTPEVILSGASVALLNKGNAVAATKKESERSAVMACPSLGRVSP